MIQVVKEFQNYALNIGQYLDKSNYKTKYFVEILGLSKPTFYRKLREHTFTIDEIAKISEVLFPKEAYLFQIQEDLKLAKSDVDKGRVVDHETVMEDIKKRYL